MKYNPYRIAEFLVTGTIGSTRSVWRHKQRSFSLVAGMILGAGILGGIFIYTDIVNQANFNSIVRGVDFEVRFDLKTSPTANDTYSLNSIKDTIKSNSMVQDAIIMYGQSRQIISQTSTSASAYSNTLEALFPSYSSNRVNGPGDLFGTPVYLINQSDIGNSAIISSISSQVFSGSFNLTKNNSVVIPESVADANQLQIGSKTNVTLFISGRSNLILNQYNVTNAVVTGIYRSPSSGNIFSSIFNQEKIYLNLGQISNEFPALKSKLKADQMGFIAVKINPDKLTLSDSSRASGEIDTFINQMEKQYPGVLIGTNEISSALLGSQIFSVFIVLFDFFLTLPVFILGIYLITFGAQLALNDRKKEIAIYKIQGASAQQIMRSVLGEILVLIVLGAIFGYIISVLVGLSDSLAIGYGRFDFGPNFSKLIQAISYLKFNPTAFLVILIFGGGLLLLIGYHRSKGFIEAEVASTLFKTSEKEQNFFFRYWIDYILFGIGVISLSKALANQFIFAPGHGIDLGIYGTILIDIPGPIAFWFGGALIISRLARIIPSKIDKYILKLRALSDVRVMIFADLRRRTINTSRVALIIALAISFAVLASVQGTTNETAIDRQTQWQVGADIQLKLTSQSYGSIMDPYINSLNISGISSVLPFGELSGQILNDPVNVYFTNLTTYGKSPYFQSDSLVSGSIKDILANPSENALVGSSIISNAVLKRGDKIGLDINMLHYNGTQFITSTVTKQIKVVGSIDHTPGGVSPTDVLLDYSFLQNLYNTTPTNEFNAYNQVSNSSVVSSELHFNITQSMLNDYYPASTFLIQTSSNPDTVQSELLAKMAYNVSIFDSTTYQDQLANAHDLSSSGFGIAGLLTSMFVISLLSATIGVFIFISLLVKSRSKEFAILRAVGATEIQIYKIALSEIISVLIFALIAGTFLGLGLAYMFNGFFEFMNIFSGTLTYTLPRMLILPWDTIIISMVITMVIIIIATILPTRRVANQEIVEETRQI